MTSESFRSTIEQKQGEAVSDWSKFAIGSLKKAVMHEKKDYGVILDFEEDPNLVGLAALHEVNKLLSYYSSWPRRWDFVLV